MDGLFINYRREDSAPYAGRLYDCLRKSFPNNQVFMDIDGIDPGADFVEAINKTLNSSRVVIAVIGPGWINAEDGHGHRRLDNPDDYVVRELSAALSSNARVIPVLVGGAPMPRMDSLPQALHALARRNAIEISDTRFISDSERLSSAITRVIDPSASTTAKPNSNKSNTFSTSPMVDSTSPMVDSTSPMVDSTSPMVDKSASATLKAVLWTGYALGILALLIGIADLEGEDLEYSLILGVLFLGLGAWFNMMLVYGKNWARHAYLALTAFSIAVALYEFESQSSAETALGIVSTILDIWAIRIMFTDPVKSNFEGK